MAHHLSTRRHRGVLHALAGGALALAAAGCSVGSTAGGAAQPTPSASDGLGKAPAGAPGTGPTTGPTSSPAPANGGGGNQGGNQGNQGGNQGEQGGGNQGEQGGGHDGPTQLRPHIVYFTVKQRPRCPQGTSAFPVPAVPLVIAWKVTGADKVELSVDGPGVYKTYGARGEETFTFSCGGAPGTVETHRYTVRTVGSGPAQARTLLVSAKVNEIPQV